MAIAIRRYTVGSAARMLDEEVERLIRVLVPLHVFPLKLVVHAPQIAVVLEATQ